MGLDHLELLLTLEKAFDIRFADADVDQLGTAGQLFIYLQRRLHDYEPWDADVRCASQRSFYRLRWAVVDCLGLPPRVVRPHLRLADVVGDEDLCRAWPAIGRAAALRLPGL